MKITETFSWFLSFHRIYDSWLWLSRHRLYGSVPQRSCKALSVLLSLTAPGLGLWLAARPLHPSLTLPPDIQQTLEHWTRMSLPQFQPLSPARGCHRGSWHCPPPPHVHYGVFIYSIRPATRHNRNFLMNFKMNFIWHPLIFGKHPPKEILR